MELAIVVALAWWGAVTGTSAASSILLGVAAPLVGFGIWGLVDFHQAGRLGEPLRLIEELAISFLAAAGWYAAGQHLLGWGLAGLSVVYHVLVYATGRRLLK